MRLSLPPAARRSLACYAGSPVAARAHVRIRWWSAPLSALERATPAGGRVLEIGCGHGLLSLYLALSAPARQVLGVDIDGAKIAVAHRAATRLDPDEANVSFELVEPGVLPSGPFDVVVICDVLYLLGPLPRGALLDAALDRLAPDGVLLVKETARTPRWKAALTVAQERLSTGVLGITAGDTVDFAEPAELVSHLAGRGLDATVRRLDHGYLHPHVLITARRSPGARS
jgi:2-polyprenyl-3-methyl-5-hydroxy-6-metoxy-1,4-benzoquinol methylase